ncbi:LPS assembly lipoprotein LptE [Histophilus somni]|uniref:LPS-assembly lipoprotein LptE n=1 Tax=Histophilus somni TaxID=731 RepID=UPI00201F845D|nr:LPS assembly lipoprotein LptE [Histophilus somni]
MFKKIKIALLGIGILLISACGFHFQNGELIPNELRTLVLESNDPHSNMSIALRRQLQANNVSIVDNQNNVTVLRLNSTKNTEQVASVFKRGYEAEKILTLEVWATVSLPNKQSYPIFANVNRTFFDNSRAALAKSAEKEIIWNDMREQAARQLIGKMIALQTQLQGK